VDAYFATIVLQAWENVFFGESTTARIIKNKVPVEYSFFIKAGFGTISQRHNIFVIVTNYKKAHLHVVSA
jgi:hypothetical protein